MKTILLLTDHSTSARNAIKYGIQVFGEDVEYILLTSYVLGQTSGTFVNIADIVKKESEKGLEKDIEFIKSALPKYTNLKIIPLCQYGSPVDVVKAIEKQKIADLVVMGTKGASGIAKVLIGSVTSSVIRNTSLPVLAIPENATFTSMNRIVFAADLHENQNENLIQPLIEFTNKFNSETVLLNIFKEGEMTEEKVSEQTNKLNESSYLNQLKKSWAFAEGNDIGKAINIFCENNNADLLAVITRHNKFFDRLFHSSVSKEVLLDAKLPILALSDSFNKE